MSGATQVSEQLDTFDSPVEMTNEQMREEISKMSKSDGAKEKEDGKEQAGKPEQKSEEKNKEGKKGASQVDKLDEEEDDPDKSEEKEEVEEDKKEVAPEKKEEKPKPQGKTIKIKEGDEVKEISPDATIKVKVDGKGEFKTLKELAEFYSKQKVDEKLVATARQEKEQLQKQSANYKQQFDTVAGHLTKIQEMMDDDKGDPLAPLFYLLDISDRNAYDYTKRIFSHLSEEVSNLSQLDDVERELYWTKKESDWLKSNQAAKVTRARQAQDTQERIAKIDRLRESQGVSEEQYVQAHEALIGLGFEASKVTPENVVDYAVMRPFYDKAEKLCGAYQDELDDDQMDELVVTVARTLRNSPRMKAEDVLTYSAKQLGWDVESVDDVIEDINSKASTNSVGSERKTPSKKQNNDRPESFDDFDDYASQR